MLVTMNMPVSKASKLTSQCQVANNRPTPNVSWSLDPTTLTSPLSKLFD